MFARIYLIRDCVRQAAWLQAPALQYQRLSFRPSQYIKPQSTPMTHLERDIETALDISIFGDCRATAPLFSRPTSSVDVYDPKTDVGNGGEARSHVQERYQGRGPLQRWEHLRGRSGRPAPRCSCRMWIIRAYSPVSRTGPNASWQNGIVASRRSSAARPSFRRRARQGRLARHRIRDGRGGCVSHDGEGAIGQSHYGAAETVRSGGCALPCTFPRSADDLGAWEQAAYAQHERLAPSY